MDTDLIDECVKAIDLIEGHEGRLDQERIKAMRQKVDQKYKDWLKVQRKRKLKKLLVQSAAGLILVFFMSSAVASALGYNLIQIVADWGKDTFHLSAPNQSNGQDGNNNVADRKIYGSIDDVLQDVAVKPWITPTSYYIMKIMLIKPSFLILRSILTKRQQMRLLKKMIIWLRFTRKTTCGTTSFKILIGCKQYGSVQRLYTM
jgi:hypothetical protein